MIQIDVSELQRMADFLIKHGYGGWAVTIGDVIALLNEQEERKGKYVPCKVKTPTGKWNGEKCSVCGTEYIGSGPFKWKFCPDCGAKMEDRRSGND